MSKKIYKKRGLDRKTNVRVAKCGHPSVNRYFKCEDCQPFLPNDTDFLYVGDESDGDEEIENEFGNEDDVIDLGCLE